jgi:hypothetical protein
MKGGGRRVGIRKAAASLSVGICLVFAGLTVPSASGGASPIHPIARGKVGLRSAVPWSEVGPGWSVALWGPAKPPSGIGVPTPAGQLSLANERDTLFLIDPQGGRYRIVTLPPSGNGTTYLSGWSIKGRQVLVMSTQSPSPQPNVTEVSLVSGRSLALPGYDLGVGYSNPDGQSILANSSISGNVSTLSVLSLNGKDEVNFPSTLPGPGIYNGAFSSSPNGSEIAMGKSTGNFALFSKGGKFVRSLSVPNTKLCNLSRWWSETELLVSCPPSGSAINTLWLVPTSGAAPTAFTEPGPTNGPDLGDEGAWQVGRAVYLQDSGACGYQYLAIRNAHKTTNPVYVPYEDSHDSVLVVGSFRDQLLLQATLVCGPGEALLWFTPAKGAVHVVLGPGMNGGNVGSVLLYGTNNGVQ